MSTRNTRKIVGIVLIFLGVAPAIFISLVAHAIGPKMDFAGFSIFALLSLVFSSAGVNMVIGQERPALTGMRQLAWNWAHRARVFGLAMALTSFFAFYLTLAGLADFGVFPDWVASLSNTLPVLSLALASFAFVLTRRIAAPTAADLLKRDARAPIVFLRSFDDDRLNLIKPIRSHLTKGGVVSPFDSTTRLESVIADAIKDLAPFIALGRPGERLAPEGAARDYVHDSDWRGKVLDYLDRASAIVFVLGQTEGLNWEISLILEKGFVGKTIMIIPPLKDAEIAARWTALCEGTDLLKYVSVPESGEISSAAAVVFDSEGYSHFIKREGRLKSEKAYRKMLGEVFQRIHTDVEKLAKTQEEGSQTTEPRENVTNSENSPKLYPPSHVALAAAIAGPLGGALFLVLNRRRLRQGQLVGWFLVLGALAMTSLVVGLGQNLFFWAYIPIALVTWFVLEWLHVRQGIILTRKERIGKSLAISIVLSLVLGLVNVFLAKMLWGAEWT